MRMSPRPRPGDAFPLPPEIQPKEAGVLILLYPRAGRGAGPRTGRGAGPRARRGAGPKGNGLNFILTRRTETVETHKGQISLPGGMQEPGESLKETALREAYEELNLDPGSVHILDSPLTPVYIPVSSFRITPFVGFFAKPPQVRAAADEVSEIIEAPLELIIDEENIREEEWDMRGRKAIVPFFSVNGYKVWGATAMVLSEFAELLRRAKASLRAE